MIEYIEGNLLFTDCDIIAHGCNAQGVMGSGVAKQIKLRHPIAYQLYHKYCKVNKNIVGKILFCHSNLKIIANCITQNYYGRDGKRYVDYIAVRECMRKLRTYCFAAGRYEVAMPKIGAGLGMGDWEIIKEIIEEELKDIHVKVYIWNGDERNA